jgi:hypothetical protein
VVLSEERNGDGLRVYSDKNEKPPKSIPEYMPVRREDGKV